MMEANITPSGLRERNFSAWIEMTCAYAVRGALQKFSGLEKVEVSLNKGSATVTLKPGNTVHIPEMWETLRKNGFTPKETRIVVRGEVVTEGRAALKVTGTSDVYELASDPMAPKALDELRHQSAKTVTVEGTLQPSKDVKAPIPLAVSAWKQ